MQDFELESPRFGGEHSRMAKEPPNRRDSDSKDCFSRSDPVDICRMQAWEELLRSLKDQLGPDAIERWLRPISVIRFDAANVYLKATPFQKAWFEEHVVPLKPAFFNNNQRSIRIHWETENVPVGQKSQSKPSYQILPDPLDPEFTLDAFLPLPSNEMGEKMAQELSRGESSVFNPVVYFGPSGSGKTHLLTAIAHALKAKNKKVFYVKTQTFTDHVVNAIRLGLMQEFRKAYREIDVLIVDDIQQLARRNATQEEFFHTFNTLHTLGRQIILSGDDSPAHLKEIEPRLISRFEWGIAINLAPPSQNSLASILEQKASRLHLEWPQDLPPFLLRRFSSPKAAIDAIHALAMRTSHIESQEHAERLLTDLLAKESKDALTHEKIIARIAAHFGIRTEDITGKSQTREFAQPRQIAMYFCRILLNTPFQALGRLFGRDHSTVISSIRQVEKAVAAKEAPYREAVGALTRSLYR